MTTDKANKVYDVLVALGNKAIGHMFGLVFGQVVVVEFHYFFSAAH